MKRILFNLLIVVWLLLIAGVGYSADLSRGYNFTDGNRVFASQLHDLVDDATILSGFYNDKTLSTLLDSDDVILVYSSDLSAFRKMTANTFLLANTNLITIQVEDTTPATNDLLLSYDVSAGALKKVQLFTISNNIYSTLFTVITNNQTTVTNISTNAVVSSTFFNLLSSNQVADVSNKVGIVAGEIVLKDSAGFPFLAKDVAVTADVTSTGANGREAGSSDSANQWFYTWVIYNGTTIAGFLSTNIAPTLPTGYTYKGLVGAVRNNSAADFIRFVQRNYNVGVTNQLLFTGIDSTSETVLQSVSGTTGKTAELSVIVPPIAKTVKGIVGTASTTVGYAVVLSASSTFIEAQVHKNGIVGTSFQGYAVSNPFELILSETQDFYWLSRSGDSVRVTITGFSL